MKTKYYKNKSSDMLYKIENDALYYYGHGKWNRSNGLPVYAVKNRDKIWKPITEKDVFLMFL